MTEHAGRLDRRQLETSLSVLSDSISEPVLDVLNDIALDSRQWEEAVAAPMAFLRERGVGLPEGVELTLGAETPRRPFPPPEVDRDLVVIRTFWWCERVPGQPQTCVRVVLEVPKVLIR